MSRGKSKQHDYRPSVDDVEDIEHLPRDIRLGWSWKRPSPIGTLLYGWCETTGTQQLWKITSEIQAIFLGFVVKE